MSKIMNKRSVKICVEFSLILLFIVGIIITIAFSSSMEKITVQATEIIFSGEQIIDEYDRNEEIVIPQDVKIKYGSQEITSSEYSLTFPDGTTYKKNQDNKYVLTQKGEYVVAFIAEYGNKKIVGKKNFIVNESIYEFRFDDGTKGTDSSIVEKEDGTVNLKLADRETFYSNVPVNLYEKSISELVKIDFAQNDYKPGGQVFEASHVKIRFTDCYDSNNYIEIIVFTEAHSQAAVYLTAGCNGGMPYGLFIYGEGGTNIKGRKQVTIDGQLYYRQNVALVDNIMYYFGTYYTMYKSDPVTLKIDTDKTRIYADFIDNGAVKQTLINDLSNSEINGTALFDRFTTGEVYMSIKAENYTNDSNDIINIDLYSIGGKPIAQFISDEYQDKTPPVIIVDTEEPSTGYNIVKNEKIDIPSASVLDINNAKLTTNVFYNYGSTNQSEVSIDDNGFIAKEFGLYTLVYTATDSFGNVSTKTIEYNCLNTGGNTAITISTQFDSGAAFTAGNSIRMEIPVLKGMNGDITLSVKAYRDINEIEYQSQTVTLDSNGVTTDSLDDFIPNGTGTYTIEYTFSDMLKSYTVSRSVACNPNAEDFYSFKDTPYIPRYVIKNETYSLEQIYAYKFTSTEPIKVNADLYVKFDDGEFNKVSDVENVKITGSNKMEIKYVAGDISSKIVSATIVETKDATGEYYFLKNYFQGDFDKTPTSESIIFIANSTSGDSTLSFVSPFVQSDFDFSFTIPSNMSSFGAIKITLTDVYDSLIKTEIEIRKINAKECYLIINNGTKYTVEKPFSSNENTQITYNKTLKSFVYVGSKTVPFEFAVSSGMVNMDITLKDIDGNAGLEVKKICNQVFNDETSDLFAPVIRVDDNTGYYEYSDVVTVNKMSYYDMLTPVKLKECSLKVYAPDSSFVTAEDGTKLDGTCAPNKTYDIKLNQYGTYIVEYSIKSENGKKAVMKIRLISSNLQPPTVAFVDGSNEQTVIEVSVGDKCVVKEAMAYSAKPNGKVTIYYAVYDNHYNIVTSGGTEFVAEYPYQYV